MYRIKVRKFVLFHLLRHWHEAKVNKLMKPIRWEKWMSEWVNECVCRKPKFVFVINGVPLLVMFTLWSIYRSLFAPPPHCRPFHLVCFECFRLFVCEWIRIKSRIESDRNNKSNLDIVWWEWYWVCTESFYICIHIMVWGRLAGFLY